MFIAPLTRAYTEFQGMPVYIDGYAYTGIVDIQVKEQQWPATAGLVDKVDLTPFEVLEKSSQYI